MSWCCRLLLLGAVALSLVACGVRGDLDPPPGSEQNENESSILDKII
jgi:hypothetical protein